MKTAAILLAIGGLFFFSCAAAPPQTASFTQNTASSVQSETARPLDNAVRSGADYLADKIPAQAKIAFVTMQSPNSNLSAYIMDTAIMHLVNKELFTVVERSELASLHKERTYQLSGEVSDETAVSIGHQLGAQIIITGSFMETGYLYSLRFKALDVKTAQIIGTKIYAVRSDNVLISLLKPPVEQPKEKPPAVEPQKPPAQTVINGDVNIINNNNTTINGDVHVNTPGWFNPNDWR